MESADKYYAFLTLALGGGEVRFTHWPCYHRQK